MKSQFITVKSESVVRHSNKQHNSKHIKMTVHQNSV